MTDRDTAAAITKVAIQQARATTRVPIPRPGTVIGANPTTYIVYVQMDGDPPNTTTYAQGVDYLPAIGSRVLVDFYPPAQAIVRGTMGPATPGVY